jgi:hypothetical protein
MFYALGLYICSDERPPFWMQWNVDREKSLENKSSSKERAELPVGIEGGEALHLSLAAPQVEEPSTVSADRWAITRQDGEV